MATTAQRFELAPLQKVGFVAVVLPVLGALGGLLRAAGQPEETVLVVVVPLLFITFFGWRAVVAFKRTNRATEANEKEFWQERDARATQRLSELIEAQKKQLSELRARQQTEQDRLLRQDPSVEQLARLMERHRAEYEALLNRRTA